MVTRKTLKHLGLIILLAAAACESVRDQPTVGPDSAARLVTAAATWTIAPLATRVRRDIPATLPATILPFEPSAIPTQTPILPSALPPLPSPSLTPPPFDSAFTFGLSVEGRELRGLRIGTGSHILMLVAAVHGGYETNTSALIEQLAAHFRAHPEALLPDLSLILIPALNPDGVARGRVLAGRFNASGVDLNRNWGCGWEPLAYFRDQIVDAGDQPFSAPETAALSALIESLQPAAVLFYHAAADGVFAGSCGADSGSAALSEAYGHAAEYGYKASFSRYPVTGTGPAWVNSIGIPSADVELASSTDPEFDRNLRGVMAVQWWLIGR